MRTSTLSIAFALSIFSASCGSDDQEGTGAHAGHGGGGHGGGGQGGNGHGGGGGQGGDGHGGGGGAAPCGALPAEGVYATFLVAGSETYYTAITNPEGIEQAIALWQGTSAASIPVGQLVCSQAPWNCPWSFHQDPATIEFAEVAIEVCDGTPSYVDEHCAEFGAQYCPWAAELVDLRDCRTDPACPPVPQ